MNFWASSKNSFCFRKRPWRGSRVPPPTLDTEKRKVRQEAGLPLMDRRDFVMDPASARENLDALCGYSDEANEVLRQGAAAIQEHLANRPEDLAAWMSAVQKKDWQALSSAASPMGIAPSILFFFTFQSMLPAVLKTARALAGDGNDEARTSGTCPICGEAPKLSFLDNQGRRWLVCSFCRQPWQTPRMFCPTCARETVREFDYFSSEEEPEYRVYTCSECKSALTTVDTRHLSRPFYPPAEQVVTQHLDMAAREQGYIPASDRTGYPAEMQ